MPDGTQSLDKQLENHPFVVAELKIELTQYLSFESLTEHEELGCETDQVRWMIDAYSETLTHLSLLLILLDLQAHCPLQILRHF